MNVRSLVVLAAVAASLAAPLAARADNAQLLVQVIKWSAVIEKDGGALGTAVDKGPKQADLAALKLQRDSVAAAAAIDAIKPSSAVGLQVRDLLALGLRDFNAAGRELHLAVLAAQRNDAKGATAHAGKATTLASRGSSRLTQTVKLLKNLKP